MTATRIICDGCGGSGLRMGTYGDLTCFDCGGEGSWIDEPKCAGCDQAFDAYGYCPRCEEYAAECERDLRFTLELQDRKRA